MANAVEYFYHQLDPHYTWSQKETIAQCSKLRLVSKLTGCRQGDQSCRQIFDAYQATVPKMDPYAVYGLHSYRSILFVILVFSSLVSTI